jgi:Ca2+-binding EF-hand superfamily protein
MTRFILVFALALAFASAAAAGDDKDKPSTTATFESLDRNNDRQLSQSEASADEKVSSRFAALDTDRDGVLTKREYGAYMKKTQPRPMPKDPRQPYK